jgi:hypothetical protein
VCGGSRAARGGPLSLEREIDALWEELDPSRAGAVEETIAALDRGELRVAEKRGDQWVVNEWVKKAILLYFRIRRMEPSEVGPFTYHDKIPLKQDYAERGVRVVPPATARFGSFLSPDVILMPSYVNIGAWVGPRTMVDTWATVGLVRADRRRRSPCGRRRDRRRARAARRPAGDRRERRVHRLALHRHRRARSSAKERCWARTSC